MNRIIIAAVSLFTTVLADAAAAQTPRPDSVWNGTVIGAATGAGVGALTGLLTEEVCAPRDCAVIFAVLGGFVGKAIDKARGEPRPVLPGSFIDDPLWTGALIGGGAGVGMVIVDWTRRCGTGPGRAPCTTGGRIRDLVNGFLWNALLGTLVDAAIPSRAPRSDADGSAAKSGRRFQFSFSARF